MKFTIDGTELDELKRWASKLSIKHKVYEDGSTPGDLNGGEIYSLVIILIWMISPFPILLMEKTIAVG